MFETFIVIPPYVPNHGRVVGQFVSFEAEDGSNNVPGVKPLNGTVTFIPRTAVARWPGVQDPFTSVAQRVVAPVVDGILRKPGYDPETDNPNTSKGVVLTASELPEAEPSTLQWTVQFNLEGVLANPGSFVMNVPDMGVVDLATIVPASPEPGTVHVVSSADRVRAELAADRAETALAELGEARDESIAARDQVVELLGYVEGGFWPQFSRTLGEYPLEEMNKFLSSFLDGKTYGVRVPKSTATACTKTDANAGIATPVPGIIGRPAVDAYENRGPFFSIEVNGHVDEDGFPHVTAIYGDSRFSRTGDEDVWVLTPALWWQLVDDGENHVELRVSDTYKLGFESQPKAYLPDGRRRPFMLYAKYPLSEVGGKARSVSGPQPRTGDVSHNTLITICKNATTGYSGKSFADDWYPKVMFLLKYANKNTQSVFGGTTYISGGTVEDLRACGTCDEVVGDGAPFDPLATDQPFVLQKIELMHGMYETLGDVIFANTGDGWRPRLLFDSRLAATSVTSDYYDSGVQVPTTDNSWKYPLYPSSAGGLLFGDGLGGSGTTGMADGTYVNPDDTIGERQWRGLGALSNGAQAGLWFVRGLNALSSVGWNLGSRLSAVGRSSQGMVQSWNKGIAEGGSGGGA